MSTIIEVLNVIIDNRDKIKEVARGSDPNKLYFRYGGPRIWSVELNGPIVVRVYPNSDVIGEISLEKIARSNSIERTPENIKISQALSANVEYSDQEWTSREAKSTFKDLYKTVLERSYSVDKYFEDIVANGGILRG